MQGFTRISGNKPLLSKIRSLRALRNWSRRLCRGELGVGTLFQQPNPLCLATTHHQVVPAPTRLQVLLPPPVHTVGADPVRLAGGAMVNPDTQILKPALPSVPLFLGQKLLFHFEHPSFCRKFLNPGKNICQTLFPRFKKKPPLFKAVV